jgi:triacylglycerol lipase
MLILIFSMNEWNAGQIPLGRYYQMSLKCSLIIVIAMAMTTALSAFNGTAACSDAVAPPSESVILLHGLCRTSRSMTKLEHALTQAGYTVHNVDYPSRTAHIQKLADDAIGKAVADCREDGATRIDFVTHSMGGILVRSYLARHSMPDLGRVVMLAPPNQGSEVVDKLGGWFFFQWINGPAGNELGTDKDSTPNQLGPAHFPLGVIAGDRTINWINSFTMIPGPDDGKVSIGRAKLTGMSDFRVIHTTHPFIARNNKVIRQTIAFLRTGKFNWHPAPGALPLDVLPASPAAKSF